MINYALEIKGLSKRYKDFVLDDISFGVRSGSITGLIGHNGAGKSTLIKSILGLVKKDSGKILLSNLENPYIDIRARCGYVPETLTFYDWMSVDRLLNFTSRFYSSWDFDLCKSLINRYELPQHKTIRYLSKGMRVKLALIMSLSHRPPILILDEPTSGLDPVMKHNFLAELCKAIKDETTQAVLISSHALAEVEQIADRLVGLQNGALAFNESVDKLLNKWTKITFNAPRYYTLDLPNVVSELHDSFKSILIENDQVTDMLNRLTHLGASEISISSPNLNDVYIRCM